MNSSQHSPRQNCRNFLWWLALNPGLLVLVHFGFEFGDQGAQRLAIFIAWVLGCLSLSGFSDGLVESLVEKKYKPVVPLSITVSFTISIAAGLVWHGAVFTGAFFLIAKSVGHIAESKAVEKQAGKPT